ncbi:MAG: VWA domain-containing protein [Candidatus Lokiarchaeota archaeon]|nr:VWA domain-containing protein [Candidatus Lokiarchaeota archaeon]
MPDLKIEDTVILLDTSRSMLRKDFKPSRLAVELQTAKNFIQSKLSIDLKDRISIISFGDATHKLINFEYEEEKLINSLKKIQISGKGILHEGIAFALQILVGEMRKIGGKLSRIFIITDNKLIFDKDRLDKMIKIAKGLGIFIDVCQLGGIQGYEEHTLKRITQLTRGEFGFYNNTKEIVNAGKTFASKKEVKETTDYFSPEKKEEVAPLVSEIALSLRRPSVLEMRLMMSGKGRGEDKCNICHSVKAPITGSDFYSEGRYCPSCERAMHLSCAAMWAKKTEYKETVFRCPFCFFLLELPRAALKFAQDKDEESTGIQIMEGGEGKETKMIQIPKEDINQIDASCSYCHSIFLGDYQVFQCEKCGSYYHKPCLDKMTNEISACRNCGAKIIYN